MNILIVEDERNLAEEVSSYLEHFQYQCRIAMTYADALEALSEKQYDIILLDLRLPDGHGTDLINHIKRKKFESGIIILSAIDELDMRVQALNAGADDYLVKPFHMSELNARLNALVRRNKFKGNNDIEFFEIKADTVKKIVLVNDKPLPLTQKEYELLMYFISNAGKVITKDAISFSVWSSHSDMDVSNEIIYTHIKNLRKKLLQAGCNDYIRSVYGVGYKFQA
ncbi:MAG: response regulator transcription factor [Bacteroidetes bacterium]|nr:response regulator transcription factor [Bacteroidota bacterium]